MGVKAPGGSKWYANTVQNILSNEKYKGDALLQKTYTADFLQFTSSPVGLKENEGPYEKLLDKHLKGAVNSNMFQSVGTAYSVGGLRKFTLAMTMLAAKKANPKMGIGKGLANETGIAPGVKATAIVDWLKSDFDLGHGHAMSIVAYIKGKRS